MTLKYEFQSIIVTKVCKKVTSLANSGLTLAQNFVEANTLAKWKKLEPK